MRRTSVSPIRYEVAYRDGSVDAYAQPDGALSAARRVFLTESTDPAGDSLRFTYDEDMRLVAITDAAGQVTALSYDLAADPYKITRVTDPFGRSATFEYDAAGLLVEITDVIGMSSQFEYAQQSDNATPAGGGDPVVVYSDDFVNAMTTPYGRTTFYTKYLYGDHHDDGHYRIIQATDPLGGTERLQYTVANVLGEEDPPANEPSELVPEGFSFANQSLHSTNTYYWDKRAMASYTGRPEDFRGDYRTAVITHWLRTGPDETSRVKHSQKRPLEGRVWYRYEGQTDMSEIGTTAQPSAVGRVVEGPDGSLVSQIDSYTYNAVGQTVKRVDPLLRETVYVYGNDNVPDPVPELGTGVDLLQVKQKNPAAPGGYDPLASYTYDDRHQVLTATDAAGQTMTYTYYPDGQLHTVTSPPYGGLTEAERTSTYEYYGDGQLKTVTGPLAGTTTSYEYDGYGRLWKVTDPEGYVVTTEYDALDRPTKVSYPDGTYEETVYDKLDATAHRDRVGRWTRTFYDALRRPVATRDAAGRTTQKNEWASCPSGCGGGGAKLSKLIDANGNETTWEYDLQGRVTKEIRANHAEYTYAYQDTSSRLKSVTDPNGNIKTYTYNADDTLKGIAYLERPFIAETPDVGFEYDPWYNRVTSMADGTRPTTYTYVPPGALGAGRLHSVDGPLNDDTITYSYDPLGRFNSRQIGSSANTQTQEFDALGRLTKLANPLGEFVYEYDGVSGRPESVTYPNMQETVYDYFDNLGDHRLQEIHNKKPGGATLSKFNYTYDKVGNIVTWQQQTEAEPAKVYEFGYDPADQLTAAILKSTDPTPVVLKRYYYAYDPAGNRTAEQIDDTVRGWTYNSMNQLVTEQAGGALVFKGTVDEPASVTVGGRPATVAADGQFTGATVVPPLGQVAISATDYATPDRHTRTNTYQLGEGGPSKSFAFDSNGNMTSDGTKTYVWDAENRLVEVKEGANTLATFTYNSEGIRTSKTAGGVTTTYVLEGVSVVEERVSTGGVTKHFQGPAIDNVLATIDAAGVVSYYVRDHLGSIRQRTDGSGSPLLGREYDPWGTLLTGADANGWAFTGREWDAEVSLCYYRARYYEPRLARFLSEDPARKTGDLPNPYAYAKGNPANRIDPAGLASICWYSSGFGKYYGGGLSDGGLWPRCRYWGSQLIGSMRPFCESTRGDCPQSVDTEGVLAWPILPGLFACLPGIFWLVCTGGHCVGEPGGPQPF